MQRGLLGTESACFGSTGLLSPGSVRSEAVSSHTGWDARFLQAVLPTALPCESGEHFWGSATQAAYGGPCKQASGKENRLSLSAQSVTEGEWIFIFCSLSSRADIGMVNVFFSCESDLQVKLTFQLGGSKLSKIPTSQRKMKAT